MNTPWNLGFLLSSRILTDSQEIKEIEGACMGK